MGKKWRGKERKEKIEREQTKLVLFVCSFLFDAKCRIVKICLEEVYDIFYHKWFVYISIVHTIHNCLYLFIILFKFYKSVQGTCTNYDLFFFISRH